MERLGVLRSVTIWAADAIVPVLLSLPALIAWGDAPRWRVLVVTLFLELGIVSQLAAGTRSLGMLLMRSTWEHRYGFWRRFAYLLLATASFSTLFIWARFPFDLFLLNLAVQAVCFWRYRVGWAQRLSGMRQIAR